MKTAGIAFKVGIFVFLGLVALGYLTVQITKYKKLLFMKGYEVSAIFDDVAGLKSNNAVLIAGVEVGRVKKIILDKGQKARVVMLIKPQVKITKDAQATICGYGVVGTKYVDIIQGNAKEFIEPHGFIANTSSVTNADQTLAKLHPILDKINVTFDKINDYLISERNTLKKITKNLKVTSRNIASISGKVDKGEGTIARLINDDELYRRLDTLATRLDRVVAKVEAEEGTLGKLLTDENLYEEVKTTISDIKTILADIKAGKGTWGKLLQDDTLYTRANDTMARIDDIVKKVKAGKGTLGKLITDESLYEEAKETLRNVRETSTTVREQTPISVIGTAIGVAR
ncbi:MAG: MlaD family protein [Candidatus Desulfofervidaceae bacterium]|nr:MlaD family protein [Candidatus Desulfofervidaceae bacterium]